MHGIYLNHAATSFPKPGEVVEAMLGALVTPPVDAARGGDPGRDPVLSCRLELAALLGVNDPLEVVLLPSATHALNLAVAGIVGPGRHVVTSVLEHNSVLRPLAHRERDAGVEVTFLPCSPEGLIRPDDLSRALRPHTALVALTHASNVTGAVQPVPELAEIAARSGVPLVLDASQAVGAVEVAYSQLPGRVFLVFSGHKGLLGPPGVGGLVVPDAELPQTVVGGTGVRSESLLHPPELPLRHEAGTPNLPGIAGLAAGVKLLRRLGVANAGAHRALLVHRLREALGRLPHVRLLPLAGDDGRVGIVSFAVRGWEPDEVGYVLRESFGVEVRTGLHCAPLAHRALGGDPRGSVRASFGISSSEAEVEVAIAAVSRLEGR